MKKLLPLLLSLIAADLFALTVTKHPEKVSINSGGFADFEVSTDGASPSYQWQVSGDVGKTWNNIASETRKKLTVGVSSETNRKMYRCLVSENGYSAASNGALLIMNNNIVKSVSGSSSISLKLNETATLSMNVDSSYSLKYQWQSDSSGSWADLLGANSAAYSFRASAYSQAGLYRLKISNGNGYMYSPDVSVNILRDVEITENVSHFYAHDGEEASFSVGYVGDGTLTFKWMYSDDNGNTWKEMGNSNSPTLKIASVNSEMDGRLFRCRLSNGWSEAVSEPAVLRVYEAVKIVSQPQDAETWSGHPATFCVEVSAIGDVTYQWQRSYNYGSGYNWNDISGATSNTYTQDSSEYYRNYAYRCVVRNGGTVIYSAVAKAISISEPNVYCYQTTVSLAYVGDTVSFKVQAFGGNLKYQWQMTQDGNTWTDIECYSDELSIFVSDIDIVNNMYRCVVSNSLGTATLDSPCYIENVEPWPLPVIFSQPSDADVIEGEIVSFAVEAGGHGELLYQWEFSDDNGNTWKDVVDGGQSDTLTFVAAGSQNGRLFRCNVFDNELTLSDSARLTVNTGASAYEKGHMYLRNHDILSACDSFKSAADGNPNDQQAQAMYGLVRVLALLQNDTFIKLVENTGAVINDSNLYSPDFEFPLNGKVPAFNRQWNTKEEMDYLLGECLPELLSALNNLEKINNTGIRIKFADSQLSLLGCRIEAETALEMDYADILVLKSIITGTVAAIYELSNFDISAYPYFATDCGEYVSAQAILAAYGNIFKASKIGNASKAKDWFLKFIDSYNTASEKVRNRSEGDTNHLFVLESKNLSAEGDLRGYMADAKKSANGTVITVSEISDVDPVDVNLSKLFVEGFDLRAFEPYVSENTVVKGTYPDPTIGGLFPSANSSFIDEQLSKISAGDWYSIGERSNYSMKYSLPLLSISTDPIRAIGTDSNATKFVYQYNVDGDSGIYYSDGTAEKLVSANSDGVALRGGCKLSGNNSMTSDGRYVVFLSNDVTPLNLTDNSVRRNFTVGKKYAANDDVDYNFGESFYIPENYVVRISLTLKLDDLYGGYIQQLELRSKSGASIWLNQSNNKYDEEAGERTFIATSESTMNGSISPGEYDSLSFRYYSYYGSPSVQPQFEVSKIRVEIVPNYIVYVKDIQTGKLTPITNETNKPQNAIISPDGQKIVYEDSSSYIVCNLESGASFSFSSMYGNSSPFITADSKYFVFGNSRYDMETGNYKDSFAPSSGSSSDYIYSANGEKMAYIYRSWQYYPYNDYSEKICVADINNGNTSEYTIPNLSSSISDIALSPDGRKIFYIESCGKIGLYDTATKTDKVLQNLCAISNYGYGNPESIRFVSSNKIMLLSKPRELLNSSIVAERTPIVVDTTTGNTVYMKKPYIALSNGVATANISVAQNASTSTAEMVLAAKAVSGKSKTVIKSVTVSGAETNLSIELPSVSDEGKAGALYSIALMDKSGTKAVCMSPVCYVSASGVVAEDNYNDWAQSKFSDAQLMDSSVSSPTADPDGDSIPNIMEYVYGTDPLKNSTTDAPKIYNQNGAVGITYTLNNSAKVSVSLECSTDLKTWTKVVSPEIVENVDLGDGRSRITIASKSAVNGKIFFRLNVSEN